MDRRQLTGDAMPSIQSAGSRTLILLALASAITVLHAGPFTAQESAEISGGVFIAGRTPIDPPPEEARQTHAYITLEGAGALRIYQSMNVASEDDLCLGDGAKIKRVGSVSCSLQADGRSAICDFSIDMTNGQTATGKSC